MLKIPLNNIEYQEVVIELGAQICTIIIRQMTTGVFLSLLIDSAKIQTSVKCLDRVPMIYSAYLGFGGQLVFIDSVGTLDPDFSGLTSRFGLYYL